jgi:hypothetical protein
MVGTMRRWLALATFVLAIALTPRPAFAGAPDTTGPPCADLGGAFGIYQTNDTTHEAVFTIELNVHAATCKQVDYVLHEFNGQFPDQVQMGNGSTFLDYVVDVGVSPKYGGTAPTSVCVYFTSELGNHIADRSPDAAIHDCVVYQLDPGSGGGGEGFDS